MLIRSQDKTKLVDIAGKTISIKRINSHTSNVYANSSVVLGSYNEENALKVLNFIERFYCKRDSEYHTLRMPKDENVSKIRV